MKERLPAMSTASIGSFAGIGHVTTVAPSTNVAPANTQAESSEPKRFHRIKEVRRQQGCSTRRAAQMLKCDAATVRHEEEETTDLPLSRLLEWQKVLDVPMADLLVDSDEILSAPIMERARMIRLMKSALAIEERAASNPQLKRLALTLIDQLKEIMPELDGVTAWNSVGQRRPQQFNGRIYPDVGREFNY
jgi:transcriptional regulator with XRE-family HTH domain